MDKALKQRLVGAIVLIALAVIVLPMIFGGRPSPDGPGPVEIELPSAPPDLEFETRRFPVGEQTAPQAAAPTENQEERQPDAVESAPRLPIPQPRDLKPETDQAAPQAVDDAIPSGVETVTGVQDPAPGEADSAPPREPDSEEAVAGVPRTTTPPGASPDAPLRYVVQVASFGSTQNATRLAGQLEEAGYAVLLDHVSSDSAQLNRVRVGPYASEASAQAAARELRQRFDGVNPRIVDLQPDQASPAIASNDPLMRWVVQVGSFSSSENAQNLVARLRLAGHSSYDETVTNDTSTIFRVRVGPFLDRDEALRTEQQIRADMGINGVVMSAD